MIDDELIAQLEDVAAQKTPVESETEEWSFGSIRALELNSEPWFVGKDIAERLGYCNACKALSDHVDEEDKLNNESLLSLGQRGGWLINESDVYALGAGGATTS